MIKKNINIEIDTETRMVFFSDGFLGINGENLQGNIVFSFNKFVEGTPRVEVIQNRNKYIINEVTRVDNTYVMPIKSSLMSAKFVTMQLVITEGTGTEEIPVFKSKEFNLTIADGINAKETIPEQYDSWLEVANTKINEINEEIKNAKQQGDYATEQGNYAKEQGDYAKDTSEELINDRNTGKFNGKSIEFVWEGTKLGIRLAGDTEYAFVDLEGKQGIKGDTGEPFRIKRTYKTKQEMEADFNNMEFGDYVMIASDVEVEDNAKLYTRGKTNWIFITDFSGATGVKGETGNTPNIQIGNVTTLGEGSQATASISGTVDNPLLNLGIPKGDTYQLTNNDKQDIANIVTDVAESDFNQFYNTKVEEFNTNAEEKTNEYNENAKEVVDKIKYFSNLFPKKKATGTDSLNYDNAVNMPLFEAEYKGNVKQETISDKNKFRLTGLPVTKNGVTVSYDENYNVVLNGTPNIQTGYISFEFPAQDLEDGDWTLSVKEKRAGIGVAVPLGSGAINLTMSDTVKFKSRSNISKTGTIFNINVRFDTGNLNNFILNPQLEKGLTATEYVPFTNGIAPNPDFPIEVNTLKGWNLLNALNNVLVSSLANAEKSYSINVNNSPDETYFSWEFEGETKNTARCLTIYYKDGTNTDAAYWGLKKGSYKSTKPIERIVLSDWNGVNGNVLLKHLQLTIGNDRPYLPYNTIGIERISKNKLTYPFFNKNKTLFGVTYTDNNDGTITINGTSTGNSSYYLTSNNYVKEEDFGIYTYKCFGLPDSCYTDVWYGLSKPYGDKVAQVNYKSTNEDYALVLYVPSGVTLNNVVVKPMIVKGTYSNEDFPAYEPAKERIDYIDLKGNELLTTDKLIIKEGKAKLIKNWGKVVLDGSESSWIENVATKGLFQITLSNVKYEYNKKLAMCNYLSSETGTGTTGNVNNSISTYNNNRIFFRIDSYANDLNGLKTWLSQNKPIVYYQLETPIEIDLGEVNIESIDGLNNVQILAELSPTSMTETYGAKLVDNLTEYTGYDETKTQVLKNINGVLTWVEV